MVRKRSRSSRKYYDEENDTDSDFALEEPPSNEPAPKKYSLRQRKRRLFTEFEFNDDGDEIEPTKAPSDDDDFQVEKELDIKPPEADCTGKETYITEYEENEDLPKDADGLIDFEDMIRADIVVNKNRIDYDNIIQKTEIKIQPVEDVIQPVIKSKRGRKPKAMPIEEIDSSLLEPETEMHEAEFEDKNDDDYDPEDEESDIEESIDCTKLLHTEFKESSNEIPTNDILSTINQTESNITTQDSLVRNNEDSMLIVSSETCRNDATVVDIDDDDVVLVEDEKKCEVIVLDD